MITEQFKFIAISFLFLLLFALDPAISQTTKELRRSQMEAFSVLVRGSSSKKNPSFSGSELRDQLSNSKVIFVCRDGDDLKAFQEELKDVWTVSEIEYVHLADVDLEKMEDAFVFGIEVDIWHQDDRKCVSLTLKLFTVVYNDKGKAIRTNHGASFPLHLTARTNSTLLIGGPYGSGKRNHLAEYLYSTADLPTWQLGTLKVYLKRLNNALMEAKSSADVSEKANLSDLQTKTLYVPDYLLWKNGRKKRFSEEVLFAKYKYNYKVLPEADLSKLILESKVPIYYLLFIRSGSYKSLIIFNSKTADMVYTVQKKHQFNMKDQDLEKISEAIMSH